MRRQVLASVVVASALALALGTGWAAAGSPEDDVFTGSYSAAALDAGGVFPVPVVTTAWVFGEFDAIPSTRATSAIADPGLLAGAALQGQLSPQGISLPYAAYAAYPGGPLEAQSTTTADQQLGDGSVGAGEARAKVGRYAVDATARAGATAAGAAFSTGAASSRSLFVPMDEGVTAQVGAEVDDLNLADTVHIDQVRSRARLFAPTGDAEGDATAATVVSGVTVAGVPVVIDETGVRVAETAVNGPFETRDAELRVQEAVTALGLSFTLATPTFGSENGRVTARADGLTISFVPPTDASLRVTLQVGAVRAAAGFVAAASEPTQEVVEDLTLPDGGFSPTPAIESLSIDSSPVATGALGSAVSAPPPSSAFAAIAQRGPRRFTMPYAVLVGIALLVFVALRGLPIYVHTPLDANGRIVHRERGMRG